MSASSSKPPPRATAASSGSASSSQFHSPRTPPLIPIPGQSHNQQACAACKYQRRKCSPDCPLAPYFPADQQSRFRNAQRLFGVSNIQKTVRQTEPKYVDDAMRTLIYEAEARAADPVGGCVGIIHQLQRQIQESEMELQYVRQQIAMCRQGHQTILPAGIIAASSVLPGHGQDDDMELVDAISGQQPSITVPAGGGGGGDGSGGGLLFLSRTRSRQQQADYNNAVVLDQVVAAEQNHPSSSNQQQLYDYFCYNGTGDEATSDQGVTMQQYGFSDDVVYSGDKQHCQMEAASSSPFVDAFDVKPGDVLQHPGHALVGPHS